MGHSYLIKIEKFPDWGNLILCFFSFRWSLQFVKDNRHLIYLRQAVFSFSVTVWPLCFLAPFCGHHFVLRKKKKQKKRKEQGSHFYVHGKSVPQWESKVWWKEENGGFRVCILGYPEQNTK